MASFRIHTRAVERQSQTIGDHAKVLSDYSARVSEIVPRLSLGRSTADVQRALRNLRDDIEKEAADVTMLAARLSEIVAQYKRTEAAILGKDVSGSISDHNGGASDGVGTGDGSSPGTNSGNGSSPGANEGEDTSSEDKQLEEIIWTVMGFIPGLNCIADIRQIVIDCKKAMEDGELSLDEVLAIVIDVAFLAMDVFTAVSIAKQIYKSVKATKIAKAAVSKAEMAAEVAETAVKRAEKAAAKTGGTVKNTNAAKKAAKTADDAAKKIKDKINLKNTAAQRNIEAFDEKIKVAQEVIDHPIMDGIAKGIGEGREKGIKKGIEEGVKEMVKKSPKAMAENSTEDVAEYVHDKLMEEGA